MKLVIMRRIGKKKKKKLVLLHKYPSCKKRFGSTSIIVQRVRPCRGETSNESGLWLYAPDRIKLAGKGSKQLPLNRGIGHWCTRLFCCEGCQC